MLLDYCCERFEFDVKVPSTTSPNIRIIHFSPQPDWETNKLYLGYFITLGYEKFDMMKVIARHISFCPYCGTQLKTFYKSSEYANEIEGETF
jgi:hypothetical protein